MERRGRGRNGLDRFKSHRGHSEVDLFEKRAAVDLAAGLPGDDPRDALLHRRQALERFFVIHRPAAGEARKRNLQRLGIDDMIRRDESLEGQSLHVVWHAVDSVEGGRSGC